MWPSGRRFQVAAKLESHKWASGTIAQCASKAACTVRVAADKGGAEEGVGCRKRAEWVVSMPIRPVGQLEPAAKRSAGWRPMFQTVPTSM